MTEVDLFLTDGEINSRDLNAARAADVRDSVNAEIDNGFAFTKDVR